MKVSAAANGHVVALATWPKPAVHQGISQQAYIVSGGNESGAAEGSFEHDPSVRAYVSEILGHNMARLLAETSPVSEASTTSPTWWAVDPYADDDDVVDGEIVE